MCLLMSVSLSGSASEQGVIRGGWYPWRPYQYLEEINIDRRQLTGLDVQLFKEVFEEELGFILKLPQIAWGVHQEDIRQGIRDVAGGAFKTRERERYAYFSAPYRNEDIILISRRSDPNAVAMLKPEIFNTSFLDSDLRLGVVSGYYYGEEIDAFITDPSNQRRWTSAASHLENIQNLIKGRVDLVPIDRLVGGTLLWEHSLNRELIVGKDYIFSGPIVALFSRISVSPELVTAFDEAMQRIKDDGRYNRIVRHYLFPSLLGMTTGQPWFFALETIGTAAFAFSGVLLAWKGYFSIFGALVLASLPAFGGGILRDLIANADQVRVLESPRNLIIVMTLVLLSHVMTRLPKLRGIPRLLVKTRLGENAIQALDAIGLATFTVTGVIVAVEEQCYPLILWGPVFSAITGAGGAIIRDVVRGDASHPTLRRELYAEISLFWGLILSIFISLYADSNSINPAPISIAVLITTLGCLFSRLLAIHYKVKAPAFVQRF